MKYKRVNGIIQQRGPVVEELRVALLPSSTAREKLFKLNIEHHAGFSGRPLVKTDFRS